MQKIIVDSYVYTYTNNTLRDCLFHFFKDNRKTFGAIAIG